MFLATFLVILAVCSSVHGEADEECTIKSESAVQCVGDMVSKIEPIKIESIPPTIWCKICGIKGMVQTENKNVNSVKNDAQISSDFFVTFPRLDIECELQLPGDPSQIPPIISKGMTDVAQKNCPADKVDSVMQGITGSLVPSMGVGDMLKLKECMPKLPAVPSVPGVGGGKVGGGIGFGRKKRAGGALFTGHMKINWANVKVTFQTLVKKGVTKVHINKVAVLSNDYDNINVECIGCDEFKLSCACVVATKFPVNLVTNAVYLILPCTVDEQAQKYDDIVQYFDCSV